MTDAPPPQQQERTCYRHPDRKAGVVCQRCDRNICSACMNQAAVGFHCPECLKSGKQKVVTGANLVIRPIVAQVLVGISAVAFVIDLARPSGLRPDDGTSSMSSLVGEFGLWGPGIDVLDQWYRMITSGFLHGNFLHIGFNMYLLWMLGKMLEPRIGRLRFGLFYFASLLSGSFGALLLDPRAFTIGASGAVFGLMGLTVLAQRSMGINVWDSGIGTLIVFNLVLTFVISNISVGGHVGGLAGGLLLGLVAFELPTRMKLPAGTDIAAAVILGAAAFAGGLWAAAQWQAPLL